LAFRRVLVYTSGVASLRQTSTRLQ